MNWHLDHCKISFLIPGNVICSELEFVDTDRAKPASSWVVLPVCNSGPTFGCSMPRTQATSPNPSRGFCAQPQGPAHSHAWINTVRPTWGPLQISRILSCSLHSGTPLRTLGHPGSPWTCAPAPATLQGPSLVLRTAPSWTLLAGKGGIAGLMSFASYFRDACAALPYVRGLENLCFISFLWIFSRFKWAGKPVHVTESEVEVKS